MHEDDRRVEAKGLLVGSGAGTTPERIAELEQRAKALEKLHRPVPTRSFAEVLGRSDPEAGDGGRLGKDKTDKVRRHEALPEKGPRPALLHPAQREVFGRSLKETDEAVVLKG